MKAQQAEIGSLNGRLVAAENEAATLRRELVFQRNATTCLFAITGDVIGVTWQGINLLAYEMGRPAVFNPWQRTSDSGSCQSAGITRPLQAHLLLRRT